MASLSTPGAAILIARAVHPHDFAETARAELLVTDKTTTLRDSSRVVRWNRADHRLAHHP